MSRDVITDFTQGEDKIDLSKIASNSISGHAVIDSVHNMTIIEVDINGDRSTDFQLELTGVRHLLLSDFLL